MTPTLYVIAYLAVGALISFAVAIYFALSGQPFEDDEAGALAFIMLLWPFALGLAGLIALAMLIAKAETLVAGTLARRARNVRP